MTPLLFALAGPAALAAPLAVWGFESDDGGFVSGGETAQWAWGEPTAGPGAAAEGARAWSTVLGGPHLNDTVDTLTLPPLDLAGIPRPVLGFAHWYELDTGGDGDAAWVETRGDAGWSRLDPVYGYPDAAGYTGQSNGWEEAWFDLSGVVDLSDVRLVLSADASVSLAGWTIDAVRLEEGDAVPPAFKSVAGPDASVELGPLIPVTAEVRDDVAVAGVDVVWWIEGSPVDRAALSAVGGELWTGGIPPVPPGTTLTWWLEATDGANTTQSSPRQSRVYLPAPTDLEGPDTRVVARSVRLSWTPPSGAWPRVDHVVYADGEPVVTSVVPLATVPVAGRDPELTVRARFDTPFGVVEGDPSTALVVDLAYPTLTELAPAEGFQGDHMRVQIAGVDLFLAAGAAAASLGVGVEVVGLEVIDVNTATLELEIGPGATPGVRDLLLLTDDAGVPFAGAFTVLSGEDRPALRSVQPTSLPQEARQTLTLQLSAPPAGPATALRLDAGPGVVVESLTLDGDTVEAVVAVTADAPLGERALVLDDGVRLIEGVTLRVRKGSAPASAVCGSATAPAIGWVGLLSLALLVVRRRGLRSAAAGGCIGPPAPEARAPWI